MMMHVQNVMLESRFYIYKGGKLLCIHLKSQFNTCTSDQGFVTSHVWKPITVQHAAYTRTMRKLKAEEYMH